MLGFHRTLVAQGLARRRFAACNALLAKQLSNIADRLRLVTDVPLSAVSLYTILKSDLIKMFPRSVMVVACMLCSSFAVAASQQHEAARTLAEPAPVTPERAVIQFSAPSPDADAAPSTSTQALLTVTHRESYCWLYCCHSPCLHGTHCIAFKQLCAQAETAEGCNFALTDQTLSSGQYYIRSCTVSTNFKVKLAFSTGNTMGIFLGDKPIDADGNLVYFA
eukprot:15125-Heterococcus_DN1.PRE.1